MIRPTPRSTRTYAPFSYTTLFRSVTLIRRLVRGEKVYEAHRSHAYQFASRQYGRHLSVTLAVAAINLFWLLPWAASVVLWSVEGALALRSEEHTSELQSLMRLSYAVSCLKKKKHQQSYASPT